MSYTHAVRSPSVAYFSMEVGLKNEMPTYAGGLGILAGDVIKSSADLKLPPVAITLVSRKGYFRQEITKDGKQIEHPIDWDPSKYTSRAPCRTEILMSSLAHHHSRRRNTSLLRERSYVQYFYASRLVDCFNQLAKDW